MSETTTETVVLPVRGNGTALQLVGRTSFALTAVEVAEPAKVSWVPDPDNEQDNTIFYVTGIPAVGSALPEGTVTLTLTYTGE